MRAALLTTRPIAAGRPRPLLVWAGAGGGLGNRPVSTAANAAAGAPLPAPPMSPGAPIDARYRGRAMLVQGASRGLGLEMVRQLLSLPHPPSRVFATCRDPAAALDLQRLAAAAPACSVLPLDVTDPPSIARAAERVGEALLPSSRRLDFLINASGVLHDQPGGLTPETSVSRVRPEALARMFAVNASGPLLVAQAFLPLMVGGGGGDSAAAGARVVKAGAAAAAAGGGGQERDDNNGEDDQEDDDDAPAVVAALSARVGSISDNGLGGWYAYRSSKAALNQLYRTLSLEVGRRYPARASSSSSSSSSSRRQAAAGGSSRPGGVCVLLMHPGTCDTALTRPYQSGVPADKLFPVERGARQLLGLVASARAPRDNGAFVDWAGKTVPW
jgi:NAD(P)-dependent dehydrogenase (short-subunit alcohol dehydrogenase family)